MNIAAGCVPNINLQEQRKRLRVGLGMSLVSFLVLVLLLTFAPNRWLRLFMLPFYFFTILCFMQARRRICVVLAYRGLEKTGRRVAPVAEESRQRELRQHMHAINLQSLAYSLLAMLLTWML